MANHHYVSLLDLSSLQDTFPAYEDFLYFTYSCIKFCHHAKV